MRYRLINAINFSIKNENSEKIATPMIGYYLYDNITGESKIYSREESYYMILKRGAVNVEPKTRVDENGITLFYLIPKDKTIKINSFLKFYNEVEAEKSQKYEIILNGYLNK